MTNQHIIIYAIASSMACFHANDIIHIDLKSGNLHFKTKYVEDYTNTNETQKLIIIYEIKFYFFIFSYK